MSLFSDAATASAAGTGTLSWSHTSASGPAAVVVFVVNNAGTDQVSAVTYGGVSMTQVTGAPVTKATGEPLGVDAYFLNRGIPTGTQTVQVSVSGASTKIGFAQSVTCSGFGGRGNAYLGAVNTSINSDSLANPSSTINNGNVDTIVVMGFGAGPNAVTGITPLGGWAGAFEHDFGTQTAGMYRYGSYDRASVTIGWTQSADDAVAIAVAICEVIPPRSNLMVQPSISNGYYQA